jgi:DNA-entry nuclease
MQLYRPERIFGIIALIVVVSGCGKQAANAPSASAVTSAPSGSPQNPIVHVTRKSKRYHLEGCPKLKKGDFALDLETAKSRGLTPCHLCNPP